MQKVRCIYVQLLILPGFKTFQRLSYFSPFLYSTCSLSIILVYLGFEGESPIFK